jgi:predicted AAA+ superfamily ATPase
MFKRSLPLPKAPSRSLFLIGPRKTGKSTLLKELYSKSVWIDLLKSDEYRRYIQSPELLRQEVLALKNPLLVVIDEVQRAPELLNEVHWLIENQKTKFVLCGSSARKLKRGHANLLGGRALKFEMFGLIAGEIGSKFDLIRMLNHGYIPEHYLAKKEEIRLLLNSYVANYLKEEISDEGLVRNLPGFSSFLEIAALSDCEIVNFSTIARECGVSSPTIKGYFQILEDTLIGRWVPAYTKKNKRRVIGAPKFYFSDVGTVNSLLKRQSIEPGNETFGKAFENWVSHEIHAQIHYKQSFQEVSYWRLAGGVEVDFIIGDLEIAVEAKATKEVKSDHLKGLRELKKEYPKVKERIIVSLDTKERKTEDGIFVLPYKGFIKKLWG